MSGTTETNALATDGATETTAVEMSDVDPAIQTRTNSRMHPEFMDLALRGSSGVLSAHTSPHVSGLTTDLPKTSSNYHLRAPCTALFRKYLNDKGDANPRYRLQIFGGPEAPLGLADPTLSAVDRERLNNVDPDRWTIIWSRDAEMVSEFRVVNTDETGIEVASIALTLIYPIHLASYDGSQVVSWEVRDIEIYQLTDAHLIAEDQSKQREINSRLSFPASPRFIKIVGEVTTHEGELPIKDVGQNTLRLCANMKKYQTHYAGKLVSILSGEAFSINTTFGQGLEKENRDRLVHDAKVMEWHIDIVEKGLHSYSPSLSLRASGTVQGRNMSMIEVDAESPITVRTTAGDQLISRLISEITVYTAST